MEGGKPENPEKNPRSKARTNNKMNPHETASTGIEPGPQGWESSAYPLRQSYHSASFRERLKCLSAAVGLTVYLEDTNI